MQATEVSLGGMVHKMNWKEGKDEHEAALLGSPWDESSFAYFSEVNFPGPKPQETVSRAPAWVAWPLPTMAERAWHFLGGFQSAGL